MLFMLTLFFFFFFDQQGFQATAIIRASEESFKNIPILAISANGKGVCLNGAICVSKRFLTHFVTAMVGDREKCLEGHMDDYISKPLTIPQLGSALERLLNNFKYERH